jgi:superfamily II DNA or RNA helicase
MNFELRDYQQDAVNQVIDWMNTEEASNRLLLSSPVATGKSYIELAVLDEFQEDAWLLTPSVSIIYCLCEKLGIKKSIKNAWEHHITTPIRFRNALEKDEIEYQPEIIIWDESHHALNGKTIVTTAIEEICPDSRWLGITATPYRGNPRDTVELIKQWGKPRPIMTLKQARAKGAIVIPDIQICPLQDDDQITVTNGEFVISKSDRNNADDRLTSIVELTEEYADRPCTLLLPCTEFVNAATAALIARDVRAWSILEKTTEAERQKIYEESKRGGVIVQIGCVSEGVDLPWLEVLIDARPTMSPVRWFQSIGRIMRPNGADKLYLCCNRNLERHAYILHGIIPASKVLTAQEAFFGPSGRGGARCVGLEGVGKFKQLPVPTLNGLTVYCYALFRFNAKRTKNEEYFILVHPCSPNPLVAFREIDCSQKTKVYEKWRQIESIPEDFAGFATSQWRNSLSEKQREWWKRAASRHGLDPEAVDELESRQFAVLPVLNDLNVTL